MELPILYALTYPDRVSDTGVPTFDPVARSPLTFEAVRHDEFPALRLGIEAGRAGRAPPAGVHAGNAQAVGLYLGGPVRVGDIARPQGGGAEAAVGCAAGTLSA